MTETVVPDGTLKFRSGLDPNDQTLYAFPSSLDPGIVRAVQILRAGGIDTFESCEGGPGHCYPEPTIRFSGTIAAGWHAVGICFDNGLPILALRRIWTIEDGHVPAGPYWEVTFRTKLD